jgi:ferredoxin
VKTFRIEPLGKEVDVKTTTTVVAALVQQGNGRVKQVCGGKGLCATCHIKVKEGQEALSPLNQRERTTLALLSGADACSRLACQAKVLGDGVVVELPDGIYLESLAQLDALIGRRAEEPLRHPVSGVVLVPSGKIITRSVVNQIKDIELDVVEMLKRSDTTA